MADDYTNNIVMLYIRLSWKFAMENMRPYVLCRKMKYVYTKFT